MNLFLLLAGWATIAVIGGTIVVSSVNLYRLEKTNPPNKRLAGRKD